MSECACGCGTSVSTRFAHGHNRRRHLSEQYVVEDRGYEHPCWVWTGERIKSTGYGRIRRAQGSQLAHRQTYTATFGPIPDGLELDHLCRIRECVNPWHLEPVTHAENCQRGLGGRPSILDDQEVKAMRGLDEIGTPRVELAERFGVSPATVTRLLGRKR